MMPKERLCRLSISQPKVKSIFGASSCSRCSATEARTSAFASGKGVGVSSGLPSQSRWLHRYFRPGTGQPWRRF
jgi:hypothetical protein